MELSERGSAAFAGKLLHRLGAELVKVEGPEGDPLRSSGSPRHTRGSATTTAAFDYFNDGKPSRVVKDISKLEELVRGADAFVLDLDLNRYAHWGLATQTLDQLGARVVCALSPFGLTGPYAAYTGTEFVTSSFGGMAVGIGEPAREPLRMPLMQSAIQAGLVGAIALLGALVDPQESSAVIDVSETDVWATVHAGTTMSSFLFSNRLRRRAGRRVEGQPYPHQLFSCKDGWISVQGSERHQFEQLVEMVGAPEWLTDGRFGTRMNMNNSHADEIDELMRPWFMERTRQEIFAECRNRKIPAAPVHTIEEARTDSNLVDRACFESYEGATGVEISVPRIPLRFESASLRPAGSVPRIEDRR